MKLSRSFSFKGHLTQGVRECFLTFCSPSCAIRAPGQHFSNASIMDEWKFHLYFHLTKNQILGLWLGVVRCMEKQSTQTGAPRKESMCRKFILKMRWKFPPRETQKYCKETVAVFSLFCRCGPGLISSVTEGKGNPERQKSQGHSDCSSHKNVIIIIS